MLAGNLILVPNMESQMLISCVVFIKVLSFDMLVQICLIVLKPEGGVTKVFLGGFLTDSSLVMCPKAGSDPPLLSAIGSP